MGMPEQVIEATLKVIEVVVSSGGINKLEAYKRLQIPELW